jgi:hypothetical protein
MALDIWVFGSGYGEMTLLRWNHGKEIRGALVDCYALHNGEILLEWLEKLRIDRLSFIVASHPHLDHIKNLDCVLRAFTGKVDRLWWWGGLDPETFIIYFDKIAIAKGKNDDMLSQRADAVRRMLVERHVQFTKTGSPEISVIRGLMAIYPVAVQIDSKLSVRSFSPFEDEVMRFLSTVSSGIKRGSVTEDRSGGCNSVSSGLIVRYGGSEVVLAGDVEHANWVALAGSADCPVLNPSIVKVGHHGSKTGRIDGMWRNDGFFNGKHSPKFAVITPWKKRLPDMEVVDEIVATGCKVYITGQEASSDAVGVAHSLNSYVHMRAFANGSARVINVGTAVAEYPI